MSAAVLVVLVAGPVLAELPLAKRMDEELVRRRRELDQLEQRWADATTECGCRHDGEALMAAVSDLAARSGARHVKVAPFEELARCRRPGRRMFFVRLEASWHQLRGLLGEFSELKAFAIVRELHLHGTRSGRLEVSFLFVVYDNPALTIDAVMEPRRPKKRA